MAVFDPTVDMRKNTRQEQGSSDVFDPTTNREPSKQVLGVYTQGESPFAKTSLDQLPVVNLDSSQGYASFPTLTKAAFVDDPQTKLRIIAQDVFPDVDPEQAINNMGVTNDGEVIYIKNEGGEEKLYTATPKGFSFKEAGADIIGKSPTIAGATIGGVTGAMGGFGAGAFGGAALGGATGEAVRQQIATDVMGQPKDKERMGREMLTEGALAAGGELVGAGLARFLNRFAARDIARLNPAQADDLARSAQKFDVQLTPAELTNLRSLKEQQATLANMPQSADVIEDFLMNTRIPQIRRAIEKELASISDEATPMAGNLRATQASRQAIKDMEQAASKAAKPYYTKAYQSNVKIDTNEIIDKLNGMIAGSSGSPKAQLIKLRNVIKEKSKKAGFADPSTSSRVRYELSLSNLDNIKKNVIDVTLDGKGLKVPDRETRRAYQEIKNNMLEMADEASPDYRQAREVYAEAIKPAAEARERMTGTLADLEGESSVKAARVLFGNQSSPQAVKQAKKVISQADPEAWNAVVRSYLQETLEKEMESSVGEVMNLGGSFRKKIFGSEAKRNMLKEALSPQQFKSMQELMDVLQATGRAMKGQSITATRQQGISDLADESMGPIAGSVARVAGGPNSWKEWFRQARLGSYSEELASIITSPDAMSRLRQLKQLPPASEMRIKAIAAMLGVTTPTVAGSGSVEQPDPSRTDTQERR